VCVTPRLSWRGFINDAFLTEEIGNGEALAASKVRRLCLAHIQRPMKVKKDVQAEQMLAWLKGVIEAFVIFVREMNISPAKR